MTSHSPKPALRILLIALPITALLVWSLTSSAQKGGGTNPAASLSQGTNGGIGQASISPIGWENGNQNGQKSHYNEGESIPYRLLLTNLTAGATYTVTLGYDITHSSKHAID